MMLFGMRMLNMCMRMVPSIMVILKENYDMDMECKFMQINQNMMETGIMILKMDRVFWNMQMAIFTMVAGSSIWQMATVSIQL